ncbi:Glutamate--tRNA ligase [uncultured archaeon]|nr:Glutamate--tRNA ligase [uncultured archaeon]
MKDFEKKIRAYALKNAIAHEGKAMQGPVISSLFIEGLKREEVGKYAKKISEIILEVNSCSLEKQKEEFEKLEKEVSERETHEGLDELPDSEKGVTMRFRPAPSGPLHLGHIISNLASSIYVKKYGGKFYVIIDDTDPKTSLASAYKDIPRDCDWIFGNVSEYLIASDRISLYYKYAEKLIEKKSAYVCTCSQEKFKKFVEEKKDCPCRKLTPKQNLEIWKKMLDKKGFKEGEAVLRFKSSMKNKNPAMRDFPLARIDETKHSRQGNKYRTWPLMNLAVAVDDMELKMTHIIRGKDHRDNAERQKMIFKVFKKKFPWVFFIGRFKFTDLVMSKRKLTAAIKSGEFSGEEDERIPTMASLRKREFKPEAFSKFIEQRGLSEVDKVMDSKEFFQLLGNFNR